MPLGPGKFDDWCTKIREATGARGVIVIVAGTDTGQGGMSAQCDDHYTLNFPKILRDVAKQIEESAGGSA